MRRRQYGARVVNGVGALVTGLVLVIVLATKFLEGAYLAVIAAVLLWLMMRGIRRHYDNTAAELAITDPSDKAILPSRVHAVVLVSKVHKPTLRALAYARATRPDDLEALTVAVDRQEAEALRAQWESFGIQVPIKTLESPYREITRPVVDYVRAVNRDSSRDVVSVFIPEYVVGHWWENLLHNQSALWLKSRLLFTPGVMVVSVPWHLTSYERRGYRPVGRAAGAVRRGEPAFTLRRTDRGPGDSQPPAPH